MMLEIIDKNLNFAQQKNINILHNINKMPFHYRSDPKIIDHIINNIIVNAIKYSQPNLSIKIITKVLANSILISIIDSGIGIPKSDLKNVGNKFFRASNAISVSGTGIGIYITKHFINLLDGKISIKSQEGIGTRVAVLLKNNHH
jgi:signal transduction histidine kinase